MHSSAGQLGAPAPIKVVAVMLIIGVLAGIGLLSFLPEFNSARILADIHQGRAIQEAIDSFYLTKGRYPRSIVELQTEGLLGKVISAQKIKGRTLSPDEDDPTAVFVVNFSEGSVKVFDRTSSSAGKLVWYGIVGKLNSTHSTWW